MEALGKKVGPQAESYVDSMERVRLREGIKTAMMVSKSGNLFITETEPWKVCRFQTIPQPSLVLVGQLVDGPVRGRWLASDSDINTSVRYALGTERPFHELSFISTQAVGGVPLHTLWPP